MSTWLTARPPAEIEAGGVRLRRWGIGDLEALNDSVMESRDHLGWWLLWAAARTGRIEEQHEYLEHVLERWQRVEGFDYGMFDPESGSILGGIGVHPTQTRGQMEIGYWVHAAHVGHGVASRSAGAITESAVALPGVESVVIRCDEANHRSAAVARRLGYRLAEVHDIAGPRAPGETGREMVWVTTRADRHRDDGP